MSFEDRLVNILREIPSIDKLSPDTVRILINNRAPKWSVYAIEMDDEIRPTRVTRRSKEIRVYRSYTKSKIRGIMESSISDLLHSEMLETV